MSLQFERIRDTNLHYSFHSGTKGARPIVFLNSLGTDFRIWQGVADRLPDVPKLMMDKRGHGLSDMGAISIEGLAQDVADLMDHLGLTAAIICGVSVGGLIAQSLAALRPDLVAGLVLSNTGAKIGDDATWNPRIDAVEATGLEPMADAVMERWFSAEFHKTKSAQLTGYRNMLTRTTVEGYAQTCRAIRDADLTVSTRAITVPTICIGGSEDKATPPELVRALSDLIANSKLEIIQGVGHLPCLEVPEIIAGHVNDLWRPLNQ
ncbi:3-oxoadipate enol-lactonase [Falsihalocynthiibacter sp. S25ZX9]|uniref:3-oxoadipate enol-lactonase n=1 Tax=Falsihalocynthiibacter sp. S25ZX9 TaxID=3240870 RepID=UPI0035102C88